MRHGGRKLERREIKDLREGGERENKEKVRMRRGRNITIFTL